MVANIPKILTEKCRWVFLVFFRWYFLNTITVQKYSKPFVGTRRQFQTATFFRLSSSGEMHSISLKNFNDFIFCPNSTFSEVVAYENTKKGKATKERMVKQELRKAESVNHRITEWAGLEEAFSDQLKNPVLLPRPAHLLLHTSGCPRPHPTWSWTLPGMKHSQLLWAACTPSSLLLRVNNFFFVSDLTYIRPNPLRKSQQEDTEKKKHCITDIPLKNSKWERKRSKL